MDTTGYGGADAFFTNIQSAFGAGTVNFIGGIAPGSTGYFSLENSVSISAPPMLAPEPSTWAMMIVGFLGLGAGGYWKSKAKVAPLASA